MASKQIIETISSKVERLIGENNRLKNQAERLSEQCVKLKEEREQLVELRSELERRVSVLEVVSGSLGNTGERKLAKARIDHLVREVDKCISLLNR